MKIWHTGIFYFPIVMGTNKEKFQQFRRQKRRIMKTSVPWYPSLLWLQTVGHTWTVTNTSVCRFLWIHTESNSRLRCPYVISSTTSPPHYLERVNILCYYLHKYLWRPNMSTNTQPTFTLKQSTEITFSGDLSQMPNNLSNNPFNAASRWFDFGNQGHPGKTGPRCLHPYLTNI